jgi:hypothetical protein
LPGKLDDMITNWLRARKLRKAFETHVPAGPEVAWSDLPRQADWAGAMQRRLRPFVADEDGPAPVVRGLYRWNGYDG